MSSTSAYTPGRAPLCRTCGHHLPAMAEQGHPTPCAQVRWLEERHVKPALTRDVDGAETCDGYEVRSTITPGVRPRG